jgi:hypothetical protein
VEMGKKKSNRFCRLGYLGRRFIVFVSLSGRSSGRVEITESISTTHILSNCFHIGILKVNETAA